MGGREENPDPAFQTFVTGIYAPSAEGGTAFFSPLLPPFSFLLISLRVRLVSIIMRIESSLKEETI